MLFTDLKSRVNNGEVVIVDNINGVLPEVFIEKNKNYFKNWVVQDDIDQAGCIWIYDENVRKHHEYNPCKSQGAAA